MPMRNLASKVRDTRYTHTHTSQTSLTNHQVHWVQIYPQKLVLNGETRFESFFANVVHTVVTKRSVRGM